MTDKVEKTTLIASQCSLVCRRRFAKNTGGQRGDVTSNFIKYLTISYFKILSIQVLELGSLININSVKS